MSGLTEHIKEVSKKVSKWPKWQQDIAHKRIQQNRKESRQCQA